MSRDRPSATSSAAARPDVTLALRAAHTIDLLDPEDTLVGLQLDAFETSVRRRVRRAPKFYFFDKGVTRALGRLLRVGLHEGTRAYGEAFEAFIINEVHRRVHYERLDYRMTYMRTPAGVEVDLVLERPGRPLLFIEVKSTTLVREDHAARLNAIAAV